MELINRDYIHQIKATVMNYTKNGNELLKSTGFNALAFKLLGFTKFYLLQTNNNPFNNFYFLQT